MVQRRWLVVFGYLFGLGLVVAVFARLDWSAFLATLRAVRPGWAMVAAAVMAVGIAVRAVRWNLIAGEPLRRYGHFWRAANIGYLGNLTLPGRAGEVLRIVIVNRFALLPAGQAMTSAAIDRVADGMMLVAFMALALAVHGAGVLGGRALIGPLGVFGLAVACIGVFVSRGARWQVSVERWSGRLPGGIGQRAARWYVQAVEGVQGLRRPSRLLLVGTVALAAFLLDYTVMWLTMAAFGWRLPFTAAITVGVFLAAGASLPSLPGYVGIYQVACLLALRLYGIGDEQAIAYSVVLHVMTWAVVGLQGVGSALSYGLGLSALGASLPASD